MNARRHLFGPHPESLFALPDGVEELALMPEAAHLLRRAVQDRGYTRSGLLFGRAKGTTLTVVAALQGRPPHLPPGAPLTVDPSYLLGANEALLLISAGQVDWCGMWIVSPDGVVPSMSQVRRWFRQGFRRGLVNDQRPLLTPGFVGGQLQAQAWIGDASGPATPLSLTWL
jgi:hypothetical protein